MPAGFVLDKNLNSMCSSAGLSTLKDRRTDLTKLVRFVSAQIDGIAAERSKAGVLNRYELVWKAVKATADAFIDLSATVTGKAGQAAKASYGEAAEIGSIASKLRNGQGVAADVAKFGIGKAAGINKPAVTTGLEDCFEEFGKGTTNIFIDALNPDPAGMMKTMRTMGATCSGAALDGAARTWIKDAAAGKRIGTALSSGVSIVNALYTYDAELKKAVDEWAKNEDDNAELFETSKRVLQKQIRVLEQKLAALANAMAACAVENRHRA